MTQHSSQFSSSALKMLILPCAFVESEIAAKTHQNQLLERRVWQVLFAQTNRTSSVFGFTWISISICPQLEHLSPLSIFLLFLVTKFSVTSSIRVHINLYGSIDGLPIVSHLWVDLCYLPEWPYIRG